MNKEEMRDWANHENWEPKWNSFYNAFLDRIERLEEHVRWHTKRIDKLERKEFHEQRAEHRKPYTFRQPIDRRTVPHPEYSGRRRL